MKIIYFFLFLIVQFFFLHFFLLKFRRIFLVLFLRSQFFRSIRTILFGESLVSSQTSRLGSKKLPYLGLGLVLGIGLVLGLDFFLR